MLEIFRENLMRFCSWWKQLFPKRSTVSIENVLF